MDERICYIVGAGAFYNAGFTPVPGDLIIAADGGYQVLLERKIPADLVVGDFDSMGFRPGHPNVVELPAEKDDTDMMAAIRLGWGRGFRIFRLYGGTGGRVDHTLANLQSLSWLSRRGGRGYLVGDGWTATTVTDGGISFGSGHSGFISVFCQGERAEGVCLQGLKYPLTDAVLTCEFPLGVSNEFTGVESVVAVAHGTLLVVWYGSA